MTVVLIGPGNGRGELEAVRRAIDESPGVSRIELLVPAGDGALRRMELRGARVDPERLKAALPRGTRCMVVER
jgi:hypothetical protein